MLSIENKIAKSNEWMQKKVEKNMRNSAEVWFVIFEKVLKLSVAVEWKMGFGNKDRFRHKIMSNNPFLLPDFYKKIFANAMFQNACWNRSEGNPSFDAHPRKRSILDGIQDIEVA